MSDATPMKYSVINRGLRPARVAIVFDGGDNWSYWARRALFLAGQIWGGAGFALVPHRAGVVDPILLRACRAYDPDYIVAFSHTVGEYCHFASGSFIVNDDSGNPLTGEARAAKIAEHFDEELEPGPGAMEAREAVARACSPYRLTGGDESPKVSYFLEASSAEFPAAESIPGAYAGHVLHCPPSWGGLAGAAVASHAGVASPPDLTSAEPELDTATLWQLLCASRAGDWTATTTGLVAVQSPALDAWPAVAVLGDSAEDFALARLIRLTYGRCVWLPTVFGIDEEKLSYPLSSGLFDLATKTAAGRPRSLLLTSVSRPADNVLDFERRLRDNENIRTSGRLLTNDAPWTKAPLDIE
ncbi:hypothetical protein CFP75_03365 [Amycolatopsis alba DSM 44262]|uniref:Uncharacterized protein n=1 Tax=Amycolatopsis alba DSM 44262 TaxID=1125972 RepID=A0A229S5H3_AMYAL|nr:hypothetical protein CFP75_03365 [Amycolatopsis alba DSM 44262]